MMNKLERFLKAYHMVEPGDRVICALSGGADSVALTYSLYLLQEKLGITVEAAHFNHHLRGEESDRDEAFVKKFCDQFDIPLHLGSGQVTAGPKGLEAAAREARYAFLRGLPGKIATAHTADDNGETVLMHLIRGTGLKGLGAIAPVSGNVIRPMLTVTRSQVDAFLLDQGLSHVEDSSNSSPDFLRNRIRHEIMPLLKAENPRIAQNLSAMALRLRQDEACLSADLPLGEETSVETLKAMPPARRSRVLEQMLKRNGVREPEENHISLLENLIFSEKPSARADFPGHRSIGRNYDRLQLLGQPCSLPVQELSCPGSLTIPELSLRITCREAGKPLKQYDAFTVVPQGKILVGPRQPGDEMTLAGGRKSLKKLFIDRKIPASIRNCIPVLRDDGGILGVYKIGADLNRLAENLPAVELRFEKIN